MRPLLRLAPLTLALAAVSLSPLPPRAEAGPVERRQADLLHGLATHRLREVRFSGASLDDVVKYLRVATGFNYVVRRDVIQKAGIDLDVVKTTLDLDDVSVGLVLALVLEPHGLAAKVEGNIVFVTTKADVLGRPRLVIYPISQLTWKKIDFHGPDIDLHPSDFHADEVAEETVVEDDPFLDPQHVVDLVKEMVDAPWDSEGWTIKATTQFLMVKAPMSVQRQVARAVDQMGALK